MKKHVFKKVFIMPKFIQKIFDIYSFTFLYERIIESDAEGKGNSK